MTNTSCVPSGTAVCTPGNSVPILGGKSGQGTALPQTASLSSTLCTTLPLYHYSCLSLYHSPSLSLSQSTTLPLIPSISPSLSHTISPSLSLTPSQISLSFPLHLSLSLSPSLSLSLSLFPSPSPPFSLSPFPRRKPTYQMLIHSHVTWASFCFHINRPTKALQILSLILIRRDADGKTHIGKIKHRYPHTHTYAHTHTDTHKHTQKERPSDPISES